MTHIPTGFAFGSLHFLTLEDATIAAERFASLPGNWTTTDPKVVTTIEGSRELYRFMQDSTLYRGSWKGIPLGRDYANPRAVTLHHLAETASMKERI